MGFDDTYEVKRIADEGAFYKKMRMKRRLYRFLGELYVGKRAKLRYFRRWFNEMRLRPGSEVLEVGSGDGLFCFYAARARRDIHVTGLELNAIEARVCQRIATEDRMTHLKFLEGFLETQHWEKKFDLIFCLDVLEHVKEDVALLRDILKALKPGGVAMIHVPHRTWINLDGTVSQIADEDAWKVNPGHVRNGYTTGELEEKLRAAGFTVMRTKRVSGRHIVQALAIHEKNSSLPRRLMVLPLLDHHIRKDFRHDQPEGNGVWTWARREEA